MADNFLFAGNQLYDWCRVAGTDESLKMVSKGLCAGWQRGSETILTCGRWNYSPAKAPVAIRCQLAICSR